MRFGAKPEPAPLLALLLPRVSPILAFGPRGPVGFIAFIPCRSLRAIPLVGSLKEQAVATQRWYSRIHSPWLWGASIALIVTVAFRVEARAQATAPTLSADTVPASGGNVEITPIAHASVQIEHGGTVIHIDPWRRGYYSNTKLADLILVTDTPGDHLDLEAITAIRKVGAPVVVPPSASSSRESLLSWLSAPEGRWVSLPLSLAGHFEQSHSLGASRSRPWPPSAGIRGYTHLGYGERPSR